GRDIDVVGTGEIVGIGRAQEAEAVLEHFDRALAHDLVAGFGADLEDREHQLLLAQGRSAFDAEPFGHLHQVGRSLLFEVVQMHWESLWETDSGRRPRESMWNWCLNTRADGRLTTGVAVMLRLWECQANECPSHGGKGQENGLTMTSTTISTTAMPGISFISRSALPLTGRVPAASFLP